MAELKISGRMSVKRLKENFKNEFGGTLRVYDGREKADDNATLASIRRNNEAKGGEYSCQGNRTVGRFEREMREIFGIKVQVATPDDWTLVLDGITLAKLKHIPEKTSKADMEALVAYKRKNVAEADGEIEDVENEEIEVVDEVVEEIEDEECVSAEEIKRLEGLSYTFTPECSIETSRFDPENEFYSDHVNSAWQIVNDIDNGESVRCYRAYLKDRANNPDGAYIHYDDEQCADFIVVVRDGKIIGVITEEDYLNC